MEAEIRILITYEKDGEPPFTMANATFDGDGNVELVSFIENEEILVTTLIGLAEFIDENIDDRENQICH